MLRLILGYLHCQVTCLLKDDFCEDHLCFSHLCSCHLYSSIVAGMVNSHVPRLIVIAALLSLYHQHIPPAYHQHTFCIPSTYFEHTINIPSTYLLQTVYIPSTYLQHTFCIPSTYLQHTYHQHTFYRPSTFYIPSIYLLHTLKASFFVQCVRMRAQPFHVAANSDRTRNVSYNCLKYL